MRDVLAPFENLIQKYASQFDIEPHIIRAIIMTESSGDPNAKGPTEDYGLMQMTLPTASRLGFSGTPEELFDPETNIRLGVKLLANIRAHGAAGLAEMYSVYNCGSAEAYKTDPAVARSVRHFLDNCALYAA